MKKAIKPKLIILSAPSGAGKTTLCRRLLENYGDYMTLSISTTTRPPRKNETHGQEYFYTNEADFKRQVSEDQFAEWATVHGYYYGTLKSTVEKALQDGKSVLLDIDVQGASSLRKSFPGRCLTFFISPPSMKVLE